MAGLVFLVTILTLIIVGSVMATAVDLNNFYFSTLTSFILYGALFAVFWVFYKFMRHRDKGELPFHPIQKPTIRDTYLTVILGLVLIVSFLLLQSGAIEIFTLIGYNEPDPRFDTLSPHQYLIALVTIGILPSVMEELLFRGLILHALLPFGKWTAVFGSAVLFSLFHMSPAQTVYQFVLGIVLALVYLRTRNMLIPILLHFVNNATIVTVLFIGGAAAEGTINWTAFAIISTFVLAIAGSIIIAKLVKGYRDRECHKHIKANPNENMILVGSLVAGVVIAMIMWGLNFAG